MTWPLGKAQSLIWGSYFAVLAASFGANGYPVAALLLLASLWLGAAAICIGTSKGWRMKAAAIVLVTGVLMVKTFFYLELAAACAMGHCV